MLSTYQRVIGHSLNYEGQNSVNSLEGREPRRGLHGICYAFHESYLNCFGALWALLSPQDWNNQIGRVCAQLCACRSRRSRGLRRLKVNVGGTGPNSERPAAPTWLRFLIIAEQGPCARCRCMLVPVTHKRNIIRMRLRSEFSLGTCTQRKEGNKRFQAYSNFVHICVDIVL